MKNLFASLFEICLRYVQMYLETPFNICMWFTILTVVNKVYFLVLNWILFGVCFETVIKIIKITKTYKRYLQPKNVAAQEHDAISYHQIERYLGQLRYPILLFLVPRLTRFYHLSKLDSCSLFRSL